MCCAEEGRCSKDCAVSTEGGSHVDFQGKSTRRTSRVYREVKMLMHLRRNLGFEYEGDIFVVRMDMPTGQQRTGFEDCH